MRQEKIKAYEKMKYALKNEPLSLITDWKLPSKLYIVSCGNLLGPVLHKVQIVKDKPYEGSVFFRSRQIQPSEARYGSRKKDCLCLLWELEKPHYYLYGSMFEVINDYEAAMNTALLIWNTVISHIGIFKSIISDRDPKFTSNLWKTLHKLLGKKLSFSTAYHPKTDGLSERMIQILEDMIRIFCSYGLELKDSDFFTHDWCKLIPKLESDYKTSINASTGKTPAMLEKGWNPKPPVDTLKKNLVDIHPST
ncbi:hypothetical protein O181_020718 [Austropuccinia psidii MF-1]|uniref:Integrase catalytic domain-containing protein n=1 Tax=Austropuccinia psidii MF-1 TaxID=1389203 RepID=A0A9Q3CDG3_9BASI|nr:hypothetical protein [Austropuccinia psidii MF-1]